MSDLNVEARKDLILKLVAEDIEETGELGLVARVLRDLVLESEPTFHEADLGLKVIKAGLTKPTGHVGLDQESQAAAVRGIYDYLWTGSDATLPTVSQTALDLLRVWAPILRTDMEAVDAKGWEDGRYVEGGV